MVVESSSEFPPANFYIFASITTGFKATFDVHSDLKRFDRDTQYRPIFAAINSTQPDKFINVCYGKEWYRYPSSFLLPSSSRYRMRFIRSEFRGQLPKLYEGRPGKKGLETRIIYEDFNDMNKEETSRYIDPDQCHYLIDSSQPNTSEREPDYSKNTKDWQILSSHYMLDLAKSPPVLRSFYLPFISSKKNSYFKYQLLRNTRLFVRNDHEKQ